MIDLGKKMKKIESLKVNVNESIIEWKYNNETLSMVFSNIDQALIDSSRNLLFVLDEKEGLPKRLSVINESGEVLSTFSSPVNGDFYYLTITPEKEVLVVCVFSEKLDRWSDWHFSFNQNSRGLERIAPAR
ncbi:streptogramin lyase [Pantoea ananatis]